MKIAHAPVRLSSAVSFVERALLVGLVLAMATLVLLNVLLRMLDVTLAWADEIAIQAMILSGFVGASVMSRARTDPAVRLLHESVSARTRCGLRAGVSLVSLTFGVLLLHLCWRWFDPIAFARAGFDVAEFEAATFNFVYSDTTPVLGVPAYGFYLVMPWFAFTLAVHAVANLVEDLGLVARSDDPAGIDRDGARR